MSRLRKRLWKAGGIVAAILVTAVITNLFLGSDKAVSRTMLGHDFLAFYAGGTFARTGHFEKLFDLDAAREMETSTGQTAGLELGKGFGPWWNPPFAAWIFAPLTVLPYSQALSVWWILSGLMLITSIVLLARMLPATSVGISTSSWRLDSFTADDSASAAPFSENEERIISKRDWKAWGLIPLLLIPSMPCFQALNHGQNTFLSLLLLTITVTLWRSRKALAAGIVCGLLAYKPQLGAVVGLVLAISLGWRALLGLATTGTFLLLVTLISMPGALTDYIHKLPAILHHMQVEQPYLWERHVTLKAFWRLLLQGKAAGEMSLVARSLWIVSEAAIAGALGVAAWKAARRPTSARSIDRLIVATIVAMPLLMPFYFDYDLTLLVVAAVVFAADAMAHGVGKGAIRLWVVLYAVTEFSTAMAGATRFCPTVPVLFGLAMTLAIRAMKGEAQGDVGKPENVSSTNIIPVAMAA